MRVNVQVWAARIYICGFRLLPLLYIGIQLWHKRRRSGRCYIDRRDSAVWVGGGGG